MIAKVKGIFPQKRNGRCSFFPNFRRKICWSLSIFLSFLLYHRSKLYASINFRWNIKYKSSILFGVGYGNEQIS